jgi:hypothetical protein
MKGERGVAVEKAVTQMEERGGGYATIAIAVAMSRI